MDCKLHKVIHGWSISGSQLHGLITLNRRYQERNEKNIFLLQVIIMTLCTTPELL